MTQRSEVVFILHTLIINLIFCLFIINNYFQQPVSNQFFNNQFLTFAVYIYIYIRRSRFPLQFCITPSKQMPSNIKRVDCYVQVYQSLVDLIPIFSFAAFPDNVMTFQYQIRNLRCGLCKDLNQIRRTKTNLCVCSEQVKYDTP